MGEQVWLDLAVLAEARFLLAQALWSAPLEAGGDPARALELAEQARTGLREAGDPKAESLAKVQAWLTERGAGAPASP